MKTDFKIYMFFKIRLVKFPNVAAASGMAFENVVTTGSEESDHSHDKVEKKLNGQLILFLGTPPDATRKNF